MKKSEIIKRDKERIANTYARYEMVADKGRGAVCYDESGKRYIDFVSGIGVNSLGFCDDGWINAVTEQLKKLQHVSNLYYTEPQIKVAEILTARTGMEKVFFSNSGAEANEAAIKITRKYSNSQSENSRNEIITLKNSFHGRTMATITATGQDQYHSHFFPFLSGFSYCPPNDMDALRSAVSDETCAVMLELVQGEGGVVNLEEAFVKDVEALCQEKGMLLIVDEVQTGIGRTGKFFAYEHFGISPDLITFAKGVGGGLPIGGVILGKTVANVLEPGNHGTTYGGNPVACAGALEVLSRIDETFLAEVEKKGEYLKKALEKLPKVKSVSGMGLMLGVELEGETAKDAVEKALQNGLMLLTAKEKIRMLPPLVIEYQEIDEGLKILEDILK